MWFFLPIHVSRVLLIWECTFLLYVMYFLLGLHELFLMHLLLVEQQVGEREFMKIGWQINTKCIVFGVSFFLSLTYCTIFFVFLSSTFCLLFLGFNVDVLSLIHLHVFGITFSHSFTCCTIFLVSLFLPGLSFSSTFCSILFNLIFKHFLYLFHLLFHVVGLSFSLSLTYWDQEDWTVFLVSLFFTFCSIIFKLILFLPLIYLLYYLLLLSLFLPLSVQYFSI